MGYYYLFLPQCQELSEHMIYRQVTDMLEETMVQLVPDITGAICTLSSDKRTQTFTRAFSCNFRQYIPA